MQGRSSDDAPPAVRRAAAEVDSEVEDLEMANLDSDPYFTPKSQAQDATQNSFDEELRQLQAILPGRKEEEFLAVLLDTGGNVERSINLLLTSASSSVGQACPWDGEVVEIDADVVQDVDADDAAAAAAAATAVAVPAGPGASDVDEAIPRQQEPAKTVDDAAEGEPAFVLSCDIEAEHCHAMRGVYSRYGSHHGKNAYKKLIEEDGDQIGQSYLYFWDDRDGNCYHGWWMSPEIGSEEGWAFCSAFDDSLMPPLADWVVQRYRPPGASIRIRPFQVTMAELLRAIPDCDPQFLRKHLGFQGDANEALNSIYELSTPYPRRAKRQRLSADSPRSPARASQGGASSSTCPANLMDLKQDEEYYFGGKSTSRRCPAYDQEAEKALLQEFRMFSKPGVVKILKLHRGAYAPSWREMHEALLSMTLGNELPKKLKLLRGNRPRDYPPVQSIKNRKLKTEVEFVRIWLAKRQSEEDRRKEREALRVQCELDGSMIECECCFDKVLPDEVVQCADGGHLFCHSCVKRLVEGKLAEGELLKVMCPSMDGCQDCIPPAELRKALPQELLDKLDKCMAESNIQALRQAEAAGGKLEQCPFCDFAVFMDTTPEENKVFVCLNEECGKESCRLCREENHIPLRCDEVEKKAQTHHRTAVEERMSEAMIRYCPSCKAKGINSAILKEDGCNKMTCPKAGCRAFFCYLCNEEIPRKVGYGHFCQHPLNPGQKCTKCTKCLLWTSKDFDMQEARRVFEAGREFHEQYVAEHGEAELAEELDVLQAPPPAPAPKAPPPPPRPRGPPPPPRGRQGHRHGRHHQQPQPQPQPQQPQQQQQQQQQQQVPHLPGGPPGLIGGVWGMAWPIWGPRNWGHGWNGGW